MKIVMVSMLYDEQVPDQESLLESHYTITGWAEALQRQGAEMIVISRFREDGEFIRNNVRYLLHKDKRGGMLNNRQIPWSFLKRIAKLDADIIHLHHLSLSVSNFFLSKLLPKKTAMVVQHHGGVSPPPWKRRLHNLFNKAVDGYFFSTTEQGLEWLMRKPADKVYPLMEGATFFNFEDRDRKRTFLYANRAAAKMRTGMKADPAFLWVGRLDANKDPLTILDGFEIFFRENPGAGLYMIYNQEHLLSAVQDRIKNSGILQSRVHLLSAIPHAAMKDYYEQADYFVLGSHYEGSGYALSEAMSCGCIPVVTNIPSFRMMTENGNLGVLWEKGNKDALAAALQEAMNKNTVTEGQACIDFFRSELSFDAIAGKALGYYTTLISKKRSLTRS